MPASRSAPQSASRSAVVPVAAVFKRAMAQVPATAFTVLAILAIGVVAVPVSADAGASPRPQEAPAVCFAPGTPAWRIRQVTAFARGNTGLTASRGRFQGLPANRWSTTASSGGGLAQGDPTVITWSYLADGVSIPGNQVPGEPTAPSNLRAWLGGIYGDFATWHAIFVAVFTRWSELTGIAYVYEPNDDGASFGPGGAPGLAGVRGDVRVGAHFIDGSPAGGSVLAYNFFPNNGDMVIDSADSFFNNIGGNSIRMRNTLAHEHGHGIGLRHVCPIAQTKLMEPILTTSFDGAQHDDTLGGQRGYGDPDEPNDVRAAASGLAASAVTVAGRSIDDNLDVDWYRFPGAIGEQISFTLQPLGMSYLEGPQNPDGTCSAGTTFDSLVRSDLALEVRDSDGVTILASADAGPAGVAESITNLSLPRSGNFFVRVAGADNAAQLYDLTVAGIGTLFADGFESGDTSAWSAAIP